MTDYAKTEITSPSLARFVAEGEELERRLATDPEFAADQAKRDAEIQAAESERKRVEAEVARRSRLAARGIPQRFLEAILFGNYTATRPLEIAAEFFRSDNRLLVLAGRPGCGKTFAAAWLLAQDFGDAFMGVLGSSWPGELHARFVDVGEVSGLPLYGPGAEVFDRLRRCQVLAIDDVGMEYVDSKGAWLSRFDQLLNARYAANLRTILTTNMPAGDFKAQYGERIADRIRDAGTYANVDGESLRGKA